MSTDMTAARSAVAKFSASEFRRAVSSWIDDN
jgi:hypothetical protein